MQRKKTLVKIDNDKSEAASSVLRKFSRRVLSSGYLKIAKKGRFFERDKSQAERKKGVLAGLKKRAEFDKKFKLGLVAPKKRKYR